MLQIRRDFDAELSAMISDLERQHLLVVTRESVIAPRTDRSEFSTIWVSSNSIEGQGNADTRANSATNSET